MKYLFKPHKGKTLKNLNYLFLKAHFNLPISLEGIPKISPHRLNATQ